MANKKIIRGNVWTLLIESWMDNSFLLTYNPTMVFSNYYPGGWISWVSFRITICFNIGIELVFYFTFNDHYSNIFGMLFQKKAKSSSDNSSWSLIMPSKTLNEIL